MKTTLNPFENAKRTAQGTGGGVSPTVIEEIQEEISSINNNLTDGIGGTSDKFRFGTDGDGNYGYIKKVSGADTFIPFKSGGDLKDYGSGNSTSNQNKNITLENAKVGDIITAFGSTYSYGYTGGTISCTNAELLEDFEVSNTGISYKTALKVSVFKVTDLNPVLTIKLNVSNDTQVTTFQYGYTIT